MPLRYNLPNAARFSVVCNPIDDIYGRKVIFRRSVDLVHWICRYNGEVYAICCKWFKSQIRGIIIQRLDGMEASTFGKVATFRLDSFPRHYEYLEYFAQHQAPTHTSNPETLSRKHLKMAVDIPEGFARAGFRY